MKRAGLNQRQTAEAAGVSQQSLSYLIRTGCASKHTDKLAIVLGVNPVWLATGQGQMKGKQIVRDNLPKDKRELVKMMMKLTPQDQEIIELMINTMIERKSRNKG